MLSEHIRVMIKCFHKMQKTFIAYADTLDVDDQSSFFHMVRFIEVNTDTELEETQTYIMSVPCRVMAVGPTPATAVQLLHERFQMGSKTYESCQSGFIVQSVIHHDDVSTQKSQQLTTIPFSSMDEYIEIVTKIETSGIPCEITVAATESEALQVFESGFTINH